MTLPTRLLWSIAIAAGIVGVVVWSILFLRPPGELVLAAGPEDGAYHRVAARYRSVLARDNITVRILQTEGSAENAMLLAQGEADAALLQGGVGVPSADVESIGNVFSEPLLLLYETSNPISPNPADWRDLRINAGVEGSGTRVAFAQFERAVGLSPDANIHTELGYSDAVAALSANEIDIAVFVAPIDAPYLRNAYAAGNLGVLQPQFVEALSRRMPSASLVDIPPAAVSFNPPFPSGRRELLALEARLAIRDDLHPALVNRLAMAALEIHGGRSILQDEGEFPSVTNSDIPINNAARSLILNGPPVVQEWVPYWMAAQLNRVLILLLPLLFIVLPLLRALPSLYAYAQNYRVWQNYPTMREIEDRLESGSDLETLDAMARRLRALDARLAHLKLPAAYRQTAFQARVHIELLQRRIITERQRLNAATSAPPQIADTREEATAS